MRSGGRLLQLLLVEDNPGDARLVGEVLREISDIRLDNTGSLRGCFEYLSTHEADAVLLDLGLPDSQGLETVREFIDAYPNIPVIVLTGLDDEETGLSAVQAGAQDYLLKGQWADYALSRAIRYAVERNETQADLRRTGEMLRAVRDVDELIVHERDASRLVAGICQVLVRSGAVSSSWIFLVSEDGRIVDTASAGFSGREDPASLAANGGSVGCLSLMESEGPLFGETLKEFCSSCPLIDSSLEKMPVVTRLYRNDRAWGIIGLGFTGKRPITDEHRTLIIEIADDIAFALASIEEEAKRERDQNLIRMRMRLFELASTRSLSDTLRAALDEIEEAVGSRASRCYFLTPRDETLAFSSLSTRAAPRRGTSNENGDKEKHSDDCAWKECLRRRVPTIRNGAVRSARKGPSVRELAVPIFRGKKIAAIVCVRGKNTDYSEDDVHAVEFLADVFLNIVQLKQRDEELRKSEERFRVLFQQAADVILLAEIIPDSSPVIRDANDAAYRTLGYGRDEFIGRPLAIIDEKSGAVFQSLIDEPETSGKTDSVLEANFRCVDGSLRPFECSFAVLKEGPSVFGIEVCRDATERKLADSRRKALEEQLAAAQRMEAVGALAGGVAHDFNNLLAVILTYTGFALDDGVASPQLRDDLQEIKTAAGRAAELTRQLLAFSRKQVLKPVPLNLNNTVTGLEKMLKRIIGEDIELKLLLEEHPKAILVDPSQIEQVIMNLVVNARDAMPNGGRIVIETSNVEITQELASRHVSLSPGYYVRLAVSDSGMGMDATTKERIFEPFFTTKPQGKGTGLGLSTVYGIVKQSGGNVWVYSEPGKGTTFKLYFPWDRSEDCSSAVFVADSVIRRGNETILLVEDEDALRRATKRSLEEAGYTVLEAAGAKEALEVSSGSEGTIHCVLTDVIMPKMNGKVLAREIVKTRPGIRVVFMSGYTDNVIAHFGVLDEGIHFISKPFSSADLTRTVRDALDASLEPVPKTSSRRKAKSSPEKGRLEKEELLRLPLGVVARLRSAVATARYDEISAIISEIGTENPVLAARLEEIVDRFDYAALQALLPD